MATHPYGQKPGARVLVGLSGGIDSAVAAALLKTQGFDVHGLFVRTCAPDAGNPARVFRCCSAPNLRAARALCEAKGIPLHEVDASELFDTEVIDDLVHERLQARYPNPCNRCLRNVIMAVLYSKAEETGFEYIATGHYAQIHVEGGQGIARLYSAVDASCDQSAYFFWLDQSRLRKTLFPLGGLTRNMVDKLAVELGLPTDRIQQGGTVSGDAPCASQPEQYKAFVERRSAPSLIGRGGVVRTVDGTIAGEHQGLYAYAIGQKKGLDIRIPDADKYTVVDADPVHNTLIVGAESNLMQKTILVTKLSWLRPVDGVRALRCQARFTPSNERLDCTVMLFENETAQVDFEQPVRAPGAGRQVVFSEKNEILGGGNVSRHGPEAGQLSTPWDESAPRPGGRT